MSPMQPQERDAQPRSNQSLYGADFFRGQCEGSKRSAKIVLPLVLNLVPARSVIDIGCGVGTWLAAAGELGIDDVLGVDGDHVDPRQLQIDAARFAAHDLSAPFTAPRRFDLALCLEVAEHLPKEAAEPLVDSLIAASDAVLFSAAIPYQIGIGHKNPRWQSYWVECFERRGYRAVDCVRPVEWHNPDVEYWYAQNAFLYLAPGAYAKVSNASDLRPRIVDMVHPKSCEAYVETIAKYSCRRVGPSTLLRELPRAVAAALRKRLKRWNRR
jgi:SAM-dependent methyltransferase